MLVSNIYSMHFIQNCIISKCHFKKRWLVVFHSSHYIFSTTCNTFTRSHTWQLPGATTTFSRWLFYYKATQKCSS